MITAWETTGRVNGRQQTRRQVGWLVIDKPRDFNHFGEYGADYWTTTVQPGRYPLYALRDCGNRWHSLLVSMPAVVKSGSWWNKRAPGEETTSHSSPRAYDVARLVLAGEGSVELLPGIEARRIDFEHNGKASHTHGLFFADGDQA